MLLYNLQTYCTRLPPLRRRVAKAPAFFTVPPEPGFGVEPQVYPRKLSGHCENALAPNHDQVEFLRTDPAGLQPPQIDHQLPAEGDHGFFLQPPVTAPQEFLPFLDRFILGLEQDYPPDHLGDNPANGPYSYFGNGAAPLGISGTPLAGYHPGQTPDLAPIAVAAPIEHLTLQLDQTRRSYPFGPQTAAALSQSHFGPPNFFIQFPEQIDPGLQQLQQPLRHQLAQAAKGLGSPPI